MKNLKWNKKYQPNDGDKKGQGKILIKDDNFNIHSFNEDITAKNYIEVLKGTLNKIAENDFDSQVYDDENERAKVFKLTNNDKICRIIQLIIFPGKNLELGPFHFKSE